MKGSKQVGFTLVEILCAVVLIFAVGFIAINYLNSRQTLVTKSNLLSDDKLEREHGFTASVLGSTSFTRRVNTEDGQKEEMNTGTNKMVRVEVDLSKVGFSFEDGTNSL